MTHNDSAAAVCIRIKLGRLNLFIIEFDTLQALFVDGSVFLCLLFQMKKKGDPLLQNRGTIKEVEH